MRMCLSSGVNFASCVIEQPGHCPVHMRVGFAGSVVSKMSQWLIAAVTAIVPFLLKLMSCGACGRLSNWPRSSGFAGFLIDQIWMCEVLPGTSSEFETYTKGFFGCAVML